MQKISSCTLPNLPNFRLRKICLIFAITLVASPLVALGDQTYGDDTYFNKSDFVRHVVRTMVPYWYVKKKMLDRSIRSFCYFDPKVENSIGCSWRFGDNANDSMNSAKKRCKQRGGSKCVQFWANGKLKYEKTPEADAERFNAVFKNIGLQEYDTGPLVEGKIASVRSRKIYQEDVEWFEKQRDSATTNPHQVACGTGASWMSFYMQGSRSTLQHVRNMCVLSCQAFQNFFDREEGCFIYSEDGKFVSSEAERIFKTFDFNESQFVFSVVRSMVPYWYYKNKRKDRSIRSFCYFDPKVEKSIGCSWGTGGSFVASERRNSAKKRCKQRGGSKCVQFWANGKLKYKNTPEADAKKFIAIFKNIGLQDYDTGPLIEGKIASVRSRENYQEEIEWFEKQRVSAATNPHHVVCGTGVMWTAFYVQGTRSTLKHVRNMCVLSCQAFQDFFDREKGCFVYSEDGIFVSSEAERILTN